MGRKTRVEFPGAVVHAWARRVDRWPLFVDDVDYRYYVRLLALTVRRFDWILLSFCLMPNHVHILVELRESNLSKAVQWLHLKYARWFNDRHRRVGRLFEHRYHSKLVEDDLYFVTLAAYIDENPVRAALCATPEEWPWSSRGIVAAGQSSPWLATDALQQRRAEIAELK